jgi:hypothetical protein
MEKAICRFERVESKNSGSTSGFAKIGKIEKGNEGSEGYAEE